MISLNKLSLAFGEQALFKDLTCNISKSDHIGLVGLNGSGKSTLLKAIAGTQGLDSGEVEIQKNSSIGYMPQEVTLQSDKNIFDETFDAFDEIVKLLEKAKTLEKQLESDPDCVETYARVQEKLATHNVPHAKVETKKVLMGLGFPEKDFDKKVSELSVGWKMRVVLAKLLLQKADFYLFDEPTNHLDIVAKEWFLKFLQSMRSGFMIVCHDRYFLDHVCEEIMELEYGNMMLYSGNYSSYEAQKEKLVEEREVAALRQQKELSKKMKTVERFRASASKAKMAQAMLKKIQKTDVIEAARKSKKIQFSFPPITRSGKVVIKVDNLAHSFGDKRTGGLLPVFKNVSFEIERGEKVAIVAPNGVGKTTLLNILMKKLPLQTGKMHLGHNVETTIFEQDQDKVLNKNNSILNEVEDSCKSSKIRALVRKFLGAFLFSGDAVYKKIRVLSGGEKNRVAMVKTLLQQANVLFLDEPTNHLDIQSKEVLLDVLKQFEGTILFVSHDRDFLDKLSTRVLILSHDGVINYPGNYGSYLYQQSQMQSGVEPKGTRAVKSKKPVQEDSKSQYDIRKKINKLEKAIDTCEKKIESLNKELEPLEYGTKEFSAVYEKLVKVQKKLDEKVSEWEKMSEKPGF